MARIRVTRSLRIPDPTRLARAAKAPELGPRVLFFSGGTALRELSRELLAYTHNSIHLITPFDSGGSSAIIRQAFHMLAVGDLRNRIMALADRSLHGNPPIFDLFAYRLPKDASPAELAEHLERLVRGKDPLIRAIPDPMRKIIRNHLRYFAERKPDSFDLRGASVGNLILAGGFFNNNRHIDPVIYLFSKLVEARGTVRPILNRDLHLAGTLADGSRLVGQHTITGKETQPITSPIASLELVRALDHPEPASVRIRPKIADLIRSAELICFPMGSFFTSVIANLLPHGVGDAVRETPCPKIYIPNQGHDPEMLGLTLADAVRTLFNYLERSCSEPAPRDTLLNFVLVDTKRGDYGNLDHIDRLRRLGVEIIDGDLITDHSAPYLDPRRVTEHLVSLV